MLSKLKKYNFVDKPYNIDWIYVGIAILMSWLLISQSGDLTITYLQSDDLLSIIKQGKFFHFYSIVLDKALAGGYQNTPSVLLAANYNILLYAIIAVWILPVRLLELALGFNLDLAFYQIYVKLLIIAAVLASTYYLYKISIKIGLTKEKAKMVSYLFLGSPVLLFGSISFGQFDYLYILMMLIAIYKLLDCSNYKFAFYMSFAIALKGFAILLFIPIIVLLEKRILYIIKYLLVGISIPFITRILFINDSGYKSTKDQLDAIYGFKNRVFEAQLPGAHIGISIFLLLFILIAAYCYVKRTDEIDLKRALIFIPLIVFGSFFITVSWHPQWVVVLVPFITLGIVTCTNTKAAILLDWGISLGYIASTAVLFQYNVDNYMINGGVLPLIFNEKYTGRTMKELYARTELPEIALITIFSACLIAFIILIYKDVFCSDTDISVKEAVFERSIIWVRTTILTGFILISLLLYFK